MLSVGFFYPLGRDKKRFRAIQEDFSLPEQEIVDKFLVRELYRYTERDEQTMVIVIGGEAG